MCNAKSLFPGHVQPKHPLNDNYYNLMNKQTVEWQIELAKKYGIEGFIYYHYYFEGKMIMEKPADNFLQYKELSHKFFFCWANHAWYKGSGSNRTVLINQGYGDKKTWERHIKYLLTFFHDDRYEKCDNKPVFMIYSCNFQQKQEMMNYFDNKCREEGFAGLYVIESYSGDLSKRSMSLFTNFLSLQTQSIFLREPSVSLRSFYRMHPLIRVLHKLSRENSIRINKEGVPIIDNSKVLWYSIIIHGRRI